MIAVRPLVTVDREMVIGRLRATGSRDPDVLHAAKAALVDSVRFPKLAGTCLIVLGIAGTVTVLLAFIGIPVLILGGWLRWRGVRNVTTIEAVYAEFVKGPGA